MKIILQTLSAVAIAASFTTAIPSNALADIFGAQEVKRWNMCAWREIPEDVLRRIVNRADYEDILRRMFNSCPESALTLTDSPTATTATSSETPGVGDGRGRESDDGSTKSGPAGGPTGDGPSSETDTPDTSTPSALPA